MEERHKVVYEMAFAAGGRSPSESSRRES